MNLIKKIALLVLPALFFLNACSKSENTTATASMTAKVDNVNWSASQGASISINSGLTNLTGKSSDGSAITITIDGQTTGTYVLDDNSISAGVYQLGSNLAFVSNQGNDPAAYVKITSINTTDSTMSGEFRFTAFRSIDNTQKSITEGKFSNIRVYSSFTSGGSNFVKCKIDGQSYTSISAFGAVLNGTLLISGSFDNGGKGVGIALNYDITVGLHDLDGGFGSPNTVTYTPGPPSVALYAQNGKVNITKHDRTSGLIEGTFYCDTQDLFNTLQASLTEGQFSIKY